MLGRLRCRVLGAQVAPEHGRDRGGRDPHEEENEPPIVSAGAGFKADFEKRPGVDEVLETSPAERLDPDRVRRCSGSAPTLRST
jgi:hypothetical protein